jgi:hypothetical protein
MSSNLISELQAYVSKDEELIWTAAAKKGIVFESGDIYNVFIAIVWCLGAIAWAIIGFSMGAPLWFIASIGIPGVVTGLYLLYGRFMIDAIKRKNTIYGLTENNIIIQSGLYKRRVKIININSIASMVLYNEKADGSGNISLRHNRLAMWGYVNIVSYSKLSLAKDAKWVMGQIEAFRKKQSNKLAS